MIGTTAKKSRGIMAAVGLLASMAVGSTATPAHAANTTNATVQVVETFAGTVLIQLAGGVNYVGTNNAVAGCTTHNQSAETVRTWLSLSQAALLSGKTLKIFYNTCSSINYIWAVDLNQ